MKIQPEWIPVSRELPAFGVDVLVYSQQAKGYAVGALHGAVWVNSTTGQPFAAGTTSHWQVLPDPPAMHLSAVPTQRFEG